ncbi:class I SAM-dependent methyltransferase [Pseudobacillus badius]|uniref:class I SAM-dependent methyltransferase n=1 Tax=Bacillus badius TaxID=1455 RepID=UPI0007B05991|nr:class I SAM-dependent methyltransferase [Bacillus badius]KZN99031.1 hypothetical protein A4244_08020 [Bacillus badius]MED0664971.1 class I SAM-dependent methyltransferase [Bacillus badius]OCS83970.1 hypothetical protein A6M11_08035 [Bacillus badius]OVE52736.1 hypothetical protein B1A98_03825 [Bacillus badius]TDW04754.1 putative SAM-dependent methyltransferase [Bacillus badius]
MIVSTSARTNKNLEEKAKKTADELGCRFVRREKRSIASLQAHYHSDCLIVAKSRLELYSRDAEEPFFFHPNSASFRVKRLMRGEEDPFIAAAGLRPGMSLLDCTLGLASDSVAASFVTGAAGRVTGVEGQPVLAYMVREGLKEWVSPLPELNAAMKRIEVVNEPYESVLARLPDQSFDIVYFDPMFAKPILTSEGIAGLRKLAIQNELTKDAVHEALRVAKHRVVLKDHYQSGRFAELGFAQQIRPASLFHFGTIEAEDKRRVDSVTNKE